MVKEYGYEYDAVLNEKIWSETEGRVTDKKLAGAHCLRSGRDALKVIAREYEPCVVMLPALACDTLLWFDGKLIGKAHSEEEARAQLKMLSGKTHQVYSGYSLFIDGKLYEGYDHTDVTFCNITNKMLDNYIASMEWKGAAGSYRIGGLADTFISNVKGSVSTVVGLPLERISDIIKALRV